LGGGLGPLAPLVYASDNANDRLEARFKQVCVQLPTSAVNVALLAFPKVYTRTKRCCSFIQYGPNHYQ